MGSWLIIPLSFSGDTFRLLWGFLLDGGLLNYRIIYTPEFPYCSPLASQTSMWLSSQTAEAAGGDVCVCVLTHHNLIYAYQAEPGATS